MKASTMAVSCSTSFLTTTLPNRCPTYTSLKPPTIYPSLSFLQPHVTPPRLLSHNYPLTTFAAISTPQDVGSLDASGTSIDVLDKVKVFDLEGNGVPITDLWKDRKAVIAFARHFGCVFCHKRADYLASKKDQMDAAGVNLVIIGPGSVDQAKAFYEQTKFEGEVYADPNHASYDALNFVSGVSTTFTPKAGLKIIQLYMEGYRQDWELSFQKDTVSKGGWQQGGIIVAGPGKTNIAYIHKDKEAGDDPPIEDIMSVCCSTAS